MKTENKVREVGDVVVPNFYIVGVFVPGTKMFAICWTGGNATSSSDKDGLMPTIGTNQDEALAQFDRAKKAMLSAGIDGDLVLIEFLDGKVAKLARLDAPGHTTLSA